MTPEEALNDFLAHLVARRATLHAQWSDIGNEIGALDHRIKEVAAEVERGGEMQVQTCRVRT